MGLGGQGVEAAGETPKETPESQGKSPPLAEKAEKKKAEIREEIATLQAPPTQSACLTAVALFVPCPASSAHQVLVM
jgi:hypothetical protein